MFDLEASRQDDQLAHWRGLFHIDAVVDSDPRLQVRDVDESSAQILADPLEFESALPRCACRPGLDAQKDDDDCDRENERD